jgi:alpha-mannosidase
LPSLGYSTYYVRPILEAEQTEASPPSDDTMIENEFYRVEFSEDGSCIKSLFDKELELELAGTFQASAGPLEFEFGMFELFGVGFRLSVPDRRFFENPEHEGTGESVDLTGEIWRAADFPATTIKRHDGNISQSLVAEGGFVESQRRQKATLYNDIKRVDLELELDWGGQPDTVLYLQMPNTLMNGQRHMGVPFAVHRDGNELTEFWFDEAMPIKFKVRGMHDWFCCEDEGRGLAIATRWPIIDFTMVPAFPLMWTNNQSGFFFGERYRQIGNHRFTFSLTSYEGTWQENGIHRWGKQMSNPPLVFLGELGPVKEKQSYLSVDAANIVVTAFKKAHDDNAVVIRLYEAFGRKTTTELRTSFAIKDACVTNLIEAPSEKLASRKHSVKLAFRPHEIKTIKLSI